MSRHEDITYVKILKVQPDDAVQSSQLKIDCCSQRVIDKIPIVNRDALPLCPPFAAFDPAAVGDALHFNVNTRFNFNDSTIRVIKLCAADELDPLQLAASHGGGCGGDDDDGDGCFDEDVDDTAKSQTDTHRESKGVRIKYDCPTCSKQYVSKNNLDRHLKSHEQDNICVHCHKHFVSENRLRIHQENHCKKAGDINKFYRSDVTVWRCTKCFQVFSSVAYANAHSQRCTDVITDPAIVETAGAKVRPVLEQLQNKETASPTYLSEFTEEDDVSVQPDALEMRFIEKMRTEMLFQCEFCNQTYVNKMSMLYHQETHTTRVNYSCTMCTETFASYVDAAKHWFTSCTSEANHFFLPKLIVCKCCDMTFKSYESLYLHKIKKKHYTPKRHELHVADANNKQEAQRSDVSQDGKNGAADASARSMLESENSSSAPPDVQDGDAENVLSPPDDGKCMDQKKKRGQKRKLSTPNAKGKKTGQQLQPGYKYQCERCTMVFDGVAELEAHRRADHAAYYKCDECDQVVHSSKALTIHSRVHQSLKPYVCDICKRAYSQTSHLLQHIRFHQGIKPFACPHEGCEARYTIRPDLKDHIRKMHTRERPFKCSVCGKSFLTGSVYYQHRMIHTNDRRYACDLCDQRFFRADALNNHRRIHNDERPFPCPVCGRHFRQKGDRAQHVRRQHPDYTEM